MIFALRCFQGCGLNLIFSLMTIGGFISPICAGVLANYFGFEKATGYLGAAFGIFSFVFIFGVG